MLDDDLRGAGWKIASRPYGSEPVWQRDGVCLPQSSVVKLILFERRRARLAERQRKQPLAIRQ